MELGRLEPSRLVFIDEMGTHTSLAPIYAYSPIGERAYFKVPRNRSKNTTCLPVFMRKGWDHLWPCKALRRYDRPRL